MADTVQLAVDGQIEPYTCACGCGQPLTPENTLRQKRGRACRECHRLKLRRQRARRKATRGADV